MGFPPCINKQLLLATPHGGHITEMLMKPWHFDQCFGKARKGCCQLGLQQGWQVVSHLMNCKSGILRVAKLPAWFRFRSVHIYMIHTCMMWNSPERWIVRWVKRREKRRCDCWVGWIAGLLHPDWYSQCDLMWVWSINCLLTKDYRGEARMNPLDFWAKKFSHFFVWGRHILHHSRVLLPLTLLDVYPLGT